jgi:hypothetical protein
VHDLQSVDGSVGDCSMRGYRTNRLGVRYSSSWLERVALEVA